MSASASIGARGPGSVDRPDVDAIYDLLERPAWHADAACREHPEVSFFPERGEPSAPAKQVCAGCLVRVECLNWAMEQPSTSLHGIWGGLSVRQRRREH